MSEQNQSRSQDDSFEQSREGIVQKFRAALQRGEKPDLNQWLGRVAESDREWLRTELEAILQREGLARPGLPEELLPSSLNEISATADAVTCPIATGCDFEQGDKLGKYTVEQRLGSGAFGTVYLAKDTVLERKVAIKVTSKTRFPSGDAFEMYLKEAQSIAQLDHPGIVPIYDNGELGGGRGFYLVLKYIDGPSLAEFLKSQRPSWEHSVEILLEISEAVAVIHEAGYRHRDLKPANILLDSKGKPYVTDFGLAIHEELQRADNGKRAGTLPYMSPEQVRGEVDRLDGRSDIWSLGVILYQMLTGYLPFRDTSEILDRDPVPVSQRAPGIPIQLDEICQRCLARQIGERYPSASALANELRSFLGTSLRQPLQVAVVSDHRIQIANLTIVSRSVGSEVVPAEPAKLSHEGLGANPYRGLGAFREQDADLFFGREEQVDRLYEQLGNLYGSRGEKTPRILPILGPSGCGKSSLARAGLIAELARRPLTGWQKARVAVFTPGSRPLESLANVLARVVTDDPAPVAKSDEFLRTLRDKDGSGRQDGLRRIASMLPEIESCPLVLFVDQFEEIYTQCEDEDERLAFIDNLLEASSDKSGNLSVVLTLRSDFLGETQDHQVFNGIVCKQGVIVPAMSAEELRRAITEPARQAGYHFEKAIVDLLIRDTRDREGALPLLQFALLRIWQGLEEGIDAAETLERIGGVGGALAGEAQRIYEALSPEDQPIVRRAFQAMVQLGEGTQDTRRRVAFEEIVSAADDPHHVHEVLSRFAEPACRLVTLSAADEGRDVAEVTHEALFEHWQTLREWVDRNRDDIRLKRRLEEAARHWDEERRPAGLLWRSPDLDLLRQYVGRAKKDLTPLQLQFFRLSEKRRRRERSLRAASFLLLLSAFVTSLILWRYAAKKGEEATQKTIEAMQAADDADRAAREAKTETAKASAVADLLQKMLASANPDVVQQADYTVRELLDAFSAGLGDQLKDQPEVEAAIRATLGRAYCRLGFAEKAAPHLKSALEIRREVLSPDHQRVAESLVDYAWCFHELGDHARAEAMAREATEICKRHPERIGQLLGAYRALQQFTMMQGKYVESDTAGHEALAAAQRAGAEAEKDAEVANILHTLASSKNWQGRHSEAKPFATRAVALHRELHGPDHPETGWSLCHLARAENGLGDYEGAEKHYREAVNVFSKSYDGSHKAVQRALGGLRAVLQVRRDDEELVKFEQEFRDLLHPISRAQAKPRLETPMATAYRSWIDDLIREDRLLDVLSQLATLEIPQIGETLCQVFDDYIRSAEKEWTAGLLLAAEADYRKAVSLQQALDKAFPELAENSGELQSLPSLLKTVLDDPARPSVHYRVRIATPGEYRLYVRGQGHDGFSDSVLASIAEVGDGPGGAADWWYLNPLGYDDFTGSGWQGTGRIEQNGPTGPSRPTVWTLSSGDYTITFTMSDDGAALDAFVFQLASLPPPTADGPNESADDEDNVFIEAEGSVVVEAEKFTSRKPAISGETWAIVPQEGPGDELRGEWRGSGVIQALPDEDPTSQQKIADITRVIEADPKNAKAWLERGNIHARQHHFNRAMTDYDKYFELRPDDTKLRNDLAWRVVRIADVERNVALWGVNTSKEAVKKVPDPLYWNTLGVSHYRAGQWEAAIEALGQANRASPRSQDCVAHNSYFVAMSHWQKGDRDEARRWYHLATSWMSRYQPTDPELRVFANEARRLLETPGDPLQNEPGSDVSLLTLFIDAEPQAAWAYFARGRLHSREGQWDDAIADYTKAIEISPGNDSYYHDRAHMHERRDEPRRAMDDFGKAIELDEKRADHWHCRGRLHSKLRQWEEAFSDYTKAIELQGNVSTLWSDRGDVLAEQARWKRATADFARASELDRGNPYALYKYALSCLAIGDNDGYVRACTEMTEHLADPAGDKYRYWAVWTSALAPVAGDTLATLVAAGEQEVQDNNDDPTATSVLGAILYRAGRLPEAIENLNEAYRLMIADGGTSLNTPAYASFFLAMAHHQQGNSEESHRWFRKAVTQSDEAVSEFEQGAKTTVPWNRRLTLRLLRNEAAREIGIAVEPHSEDETTAPASGNVDDGASEPKSPDSIDAQAN